MHPGESTHVRGLARELEVSAAAVGRELARLAEAGLLTREAVGNQSRYALNPAAPGLAELRGLFLKTAGATGRLRAALEEVSCVELAFVYGSFASGEATAHSDLDILVVGTATDRDLAKPLAAVERELGREVNTVLFTRDEVMMRLNLHDGFVTQVLGGPRVVLVGSGEDAILGSPGTGQPVG